jgi:hypothetical protein
MQDLATLLKDYSGQQTLSLFMNYVGTPKYFVSTDKSQNQCAPNTMQNGLWVLSMKPFASGRTKYTTNDNIRL